MGQPGAADPVISAGALERKDVANLRGKSVPVRLIKKQQHFTTDPKLDRELVQIRPLDKL